MNEPITKEEQMPPAWVGSIEGVGYRLHLERMCDYWAKRTARLEADATDLRASLRREENARDILARDNDRLRGRLAILGWSSSP